MTSAAVRATAEAVPAGKRQRQKDDDRPGVAWFDAPASPLTTLFVQRKSACACGGGCPSCREEDASHKNRLQKKVRVSQPSDSFEAEADRVADHVMTMPEGARGAFDISSVRADTGAIPKGFTHPTGAGDPLAPATRAFFESRFNRDFSAVRIHADASAAAATNAVNARAYTLGRDIVFGVGEYSPASRGGSHLLAHELVHVIQQDGQRHPVVQRQPLDQDDDDADEPPLTRPQEIALSRSSPGEIAGQAEPLTLSLYNFGIDIAQPKPEHREALNELGRFLHERASAPTIVRSIGFADSTGDERHNLVLSRRRAEAVKAILDPLITQRITITARGEQNPAATNETVAGRSRNRRVDIRFFVDTPVPPPRPRRPPVPPGQQPPGTEPPGPRPPGTEPPGTEPRPDDDHGICDDFPILCGLGVVPFFVPLICLIAPEVCIAVGCVLAPELCLPPVPPTPPTPPEKPPERPGGPPIVTFVPDVRAPNTPGGMNDRIGLRDPVHVMAVVVNTPPATSPITVEVDGVGPNGGNATINGQAQIQIVGTTALDVLGAAMSAENYPFSPFLQLAAWWGQQLVGASNRFAVSSIAENWSVVLAGAHRGPFGWVFQADMPWESDSGDHHDLDACQYVERVNVDEERGGMVGMGVGQINDPNNPDTADYPPAFDEHGTPFQYTRVDGFSRLKQLFTIRDRRSNSNWAPSSNSGFVIERLFERDPADPRCWHFVVTKRGAVVDVDGWHAAAGAGAISHEFRHINCDPPPPPPAPPEEPHEEPPEPEPREEPQDPQQAPPVAPCDRAELARRVDACIEAAKQQAIDCTLGLVGFSGGWEGVVESLDYLGCLEEMRQELLRCDQRAKRDTNCPDSPPPPAPGPHLA